MQQLEKSENLQGLLQKKKVEQEKGSKIKRCQSHFGTLDKQLSTTFNDSKHNENNVTGDHGRNSRFTIKRKADDHHCMELPRDIDQIDFFEHLDRKSTQMGEGISQNRHYNKTSQREQARHKLRQFSSNLEDLLKSHFLNKEDAEYQNAINLLEKA